MKCLNCSTDFSPIKNRSTKFCSLSCSSTYHNKQRIHSSETKQKIASSLTGKKRPYTKPRKLETRKCLICDNEFSTPVWKKTVTCSMQCGAQLAFQRRSKPTSRCLHIPYFCKDMNQTVILQSNWETNIAEFLDLHNISWIRPAPIDWIDSKGKPHKYYPDFYLPGKNLYLDPKNGQVAKLDAEKIAVVSSKIHLIVGSPEDIKRQLT